MARDYAMAMPESESECHIDKEVKEHCLEQPQEDITISINYNLFFDLPTSPKSNMECKARCKTCRKFYKYTSNSKGNLLKHLQGSHLRLLRDHKDEQTREANCHMKQQQTLVKNCTLAKRAVSSDFRHQDKIVTSIVRNLCGRGGLPITTVEQECFRDFMADVEPKFSHVSRVAVVSKLDKIYENEKMLLFKEISLSCITPSVTLNFWTGRDNRSFMGCTVHYIFKQQLQSRMLSSVEVPPPHTADRIKDRFEDELDRFGISCFKVVTDNAANMKAAFKMSSEETTSLNDEDNVDLEDSDLLAKEWTPHHFTFDGWLGCSAHQIQLVVQDGYNELLG